MPATYTPWVHHPPRCTSRLPVIAVPGVLVPDDGALGSTLRLVMEMRRREPCQALRVLCAVCPDAQSYSGLPVRTVDKIG